MPFNFGTEIKIFFYTSYLFYRFYIFGSFYLIPYLEMAFYRRPTSKKTETK